MRNYLNIPDTQLLITERKTQAALFINAILWKTTHTE